MKCIRRCRGFTLAELMTSMAILALLAAILMPAFISVRNHAQRIKCMSNLRQLGMAVSMYVGESNCQLPYCNWANTPDSTNYYSIGWLFAFPQARVGFPATSDLNGYWFMLPHPPADGMQTGVLWPYINSMEVYHCPADDPDFRVGTEFLTSYLMSGAQCGYGRLGKAPGCTEGLKITQINHPSESVMFWEALEQNYQGQQNTLFVWNDGSSQPSEEVLSDRHEKGANVCCFDGHVEWFDKGTWNYWVNLPGPGRLWCDPLSPDGR